MFVTDRGLGRWSSAFQRPPICFHSRRAWSSFRNGFAGHSSWLYSYTAHEFVFTTSKRCGMRNNNSFKEGPGDTALKNKSSKLPRSACMWKNISCSKQYSRSCTGVCFQLSIRNGHKFHISVLLMLTWVSYVPIQSKLVFILKLLEVSGIPLIWFLLS